MGKVELNLVEGSVCPDRLHKRRFFSFFFFSFLSFQHIKRMFGYTLE